MSRSTSFAARAEETVLYRRPNVKTFGFFASESDSVKEIEPMKQFFANIVENLTFVLEFVGIVAVLVLVALIAEKLIARRNGEKGGSLTARKTATIGMFAAIAGVLMTIEVPMPFAPPFYAIDASELPALLCGFAFGPVAGVLTEFVKIIIKLLLKPTTTAFVGELANFCVGCSMILPAVILYHIKKKKTTAIAGSAVGTLCMTLFGTFFNAVYLLPTFAVMYSMPLEGLIEMGTAINPAVTNIVTFVAFCVAPLNLLKGTFVSVLTFLLYKPLSPILKVSYDRSAVQRGRAENV
jgi:riboflavin transporter FmnP